MISSTRIGIAIFSLFTYCTLLLGEVVTVNVTIESINSTKRTIDVRYADKKRELELSRKTVVFVGGKAADIEALVPGDEAKIEFDRDLEIVTRIDAKGMNSLGWRFFDINNKNLDIKKTLSVNKEGELVCNPGAGSFCLASISKYDQCTFRIQFRYLSAKGKGNASIIVGSKLPNPSSSDWQKQIPLGIEVKLVQGRVGEIIVPSDDYKVELPLGQLRDGRKIVVLRQPIVKESDWNDLEIKTDMFRNVTAIVNGVTANAIAKVEESKGHIVIWPQNLDIQFRNPSIMVDGAETSLSFDTILSN